jgi:beta-lactamase regulating signal transducer with metallopeptidase domain
MSDLFMPPILMGAAPFALAVAASGAGLGALLLIMEGLLRRRAEGLRYGILMGGILVLLAVPALVGMGLRLPPELFWPATNVEVVKVPAERLADLLHQAGETAPQPEVDTDVAWVPLLILAFAALWLLGIIIGLGRLLAAVRRHGRMILGAPWQADYWTEALKAQCARRLGLRRFPDVRRAPAAPMPMVVGTWRPVIVVPEEAPASWGQAQWEAILLHEAAHIARRDPWAVLAQRLAVILYWWCPPIHGVSRRLSALRENICDDYALTGSCDPIAYAEILVESAERLLRLKAMPVPLALLDSTQRGLEVRVTRLLAKEKRPMLKLSFVGKLFAAGILGAACLATTAATALSQGPEKKVHIKIVVDGKEIDLSEHVAAAQKKSEPKIEFKFHTERAGPSADVFFVQPKSDVIVTKKSDDPRIEELVKQAEAIKPGSGAAIRKALQGTPKEGDTARYISAITFSPDGKHLVTSKDKVIQYFDAATGKQTSASMKLADGKKIIILSIEGDKVIQLPSGDVKRILEAGVQASPRTEAAPSKRPIISDPKKAAEHIELDVNVTPSILTNTTAAAPNPSADVEALRRQIERLADQLQALERRLGMKK